MSLKLASLIFPNDCSLEINERDESLQKIPSLYFKAFSAVTIPILLIQILSNNIVIVYANFFASESLGYNSIEDTPITQIFPTWSVPQHSLRSLKQTSCQAITKSGSEIAYDILINPLDKQLNLWVLNLHIKPTQSPSRYQNEFQEIQQIGKGTFGIVVKARNKIDQQIYAIKILKINSQIDELIKSNNDLLNEVKMFASLPYHPNVVRYCTAWIEPAMYTSSSVFYIQMQLCPFTDLSKFIESRTRIDCTENKEILFQILQGLSHIHDQKVVHCDLKPANIFLDGKRVLLGDFGLSRQTINQDPKTRRLRESQLNETGTFLYTSPEIESNQSFTTKSDIFAFGIVFVELFSMFSTFMERALLKKLPRVLGNEIYKEEFALAELCLSTLPESRPDASELLMNDMFGERLHYEPISPVSSGNKRWSTSSRMSYS